MTTEVEDFGLRCHLKAERVDATAGVIYGATVAKAGVDALGKFVYLDQNGQLMRSPEGSVRKLQVKTDAKTLETLLAAAKAVGGSAKSREDHDDSISARAGYADNYRLEGDRVICDLHLFDSYANRAIVLETAAKTPDAIGLSIDFTPSFEIQKDCALMRVSDLEAVDIVDAGAITPAGLFLKRTLDNETLSKPTLLMADDKKPATLDECMAAISALASTCTQLSASVAELKKGAPGDPAHLAAINELKTQLSATNEGIATLKKEQAALGMKFSSGGGDQAAESERMRLAKEKEEADGKAKKTYLQLVKEKVDGSAGKLKASDAHREVQRDNPAAYRLHLSGKGVTGANMAA